MSRIEAVGAVVDRPWPTPPVLRRFSQAVVNRRVGGTREIENGKRGSGTVVLDRPLRIDVAAAS